MQTLGNLENGVDHEAVLDLLVVLDEEVEHHLAELVAYATREVVQQTQQVLEANEL